MLRRAVLLYTVKIAEMVSSRRLAKPPAAPATVFEHWIFRILLSGTGTLVAISTAPRI